MVIVVRFLRIQTGLSFSEFAFSNPIIGLTLEAVGMDPTSSQKLLIFADTYS
jgi:hypothetical protein